MNQGFVAWALRHLWPTRALRGAQTMALRHLWPMRGAQAALRQLRCARAAALVAVVLLAVAGCGFVGGGQKSPAGNVRHSGGQKSLAGNVRHSVRQKSPAGYVRHCVRLLDREALYADRPEWQEAKATILAEAKTLATMEEAHEAVTRAAKAAGGKHSFLAPPVRDTASYPEVAPEFTLLDGGILHVILPTHTGVKVSDSLYVHSVLDFLQEHRDAKGVVLDLRGNTGGNMGPMIAAASPLLPDGVILRFKGRKRTMPVWLEGIQQGVGLAAGSVGKFPASTPVAILTDGMTGSSGEATLLCFRGLENARTFGAPTAGYASANIVKPLADGYSLVITVSCDMARTGETFCEDPIAPDVATESPLEDAVAWIEAR